MSTAANIDFQPGLFDGGPSETAREQPTVPPKRRKRHALVIATGVLVLTALLFAFFATLIKPQTLPEMLQEGMEAPIGALSGPEKYASAIPATSRSYASASGGFCDGYEAMCFTSMTNTPSKTLAKMATAVPKGQAKRYRVNVSITPLDE